ncbi:hypothetical protein ABPG72_009460, partial [Tetrahymena utriculariae]
MRNLVNQQLNSNLDKIRYMFCGVYQQYKQIRNIQHTFILISSLIAMPIYISGLNSSEKVSQQKSNMLNGDYEPIRSFVEINDILFIASLNLGDQVWAHQITSLMNQNQMIELLMMYFSAHQGKFLHIMKFDRFCVPIVYQ